MKTATEVLTKILNERIKFWQDVWIATASSSNVSSKDVCTKWADLALKDYQSKFQNDIDLTLQISLRDSEIIDLQDKIIEQQMLIADLEESLNAKSIDGAEPKSDL